MTVNQIYSFKSYELNDFYVAEVYQARKLERERSEQYSFTCKLYIWSGRREGGRDGGKERGREKEKKGILKWNKNHGEGQRTQAAMEAAW